MSIPEYKLCVFGSGGVGKSCLVRRMLSHIRRDQRLSLFSRQCSSFKESFWPNTIQLLRMSTKRCSLTIESLLIALNLVVDGGNRRKRIFVGNTRYSRHGQRRRTHSLLLTDVVRSSRKSSLRWETCTWKMGKASFWSTPLLRKPPSMTWKNSTSELCVWKIPKFT